MNHTEDAFDVMCAKNNDCKTSGPFLLFIDNMPTAKLLKAKSCMQCASAGES